MNMIKAEDSFKRKAYYLGLIFPVPDCLAQVITSYNTKQVVR